MSNCTEKEQQNEFSLFTDLEDIIGDIADRAEVTADTVSLIWNKFYEAHEKYQRANTCEERHTWRLSLSMLAADFMPVLRLLRDYTNNNKIRAEKLLDYFYARIDN